MSDAPSDMPNPIGSGVAKPAVAAAQRKRWLAVGYDFAQQFVACVLQLGSTRRHVRREFVRSLARAT